MKIIMTSQGPDTADQLDPRFGRAAYFILFDTDSRQSSAIANDAASASGGAGIASAQSIINMNADVLITGRLGPKAFDVLINSDLDCYQGKAGSITENLAAFEQGSLQKIASSGPDHGGIQFHGGRQ